MTSPETSSEIFPAPSKAATLAQAELAAIEVVDVVHRYPPIGPRRSKARPNQGSGRELALDHISMQVPAGGIFGLLGPNGGGKSTLFRIIATLQRATAGTVRVLGHDVVAASHQVRSLLGVLFQMPSLDAQLSAYENLRYQGHLYGLKGRELNGRIDLWLDRLGLADNRDDRVLAFSGGMRRRLELAKALLHNPRLLLLDEPATGLDPAARRDVWLHLTRLRDEAGVTVALTTHLMEEADRCDSLAIINDGRLLAMDTPDRFKASIGGDIIVITPAGELSPPQLDILRQKLQDALAPAGGQVTVAIVDGKLFAECPDGPSHVARIGAAMAGEVRSISVGQPTLEDVFMHLTGRSMKRVAF